MWGCLWSSFSWWGLGRPPFWTFEKKLRAEKTQNSSYIGIPGKGPGRRPRGLVRAWYAQRATRLKTKCYKNIFGNGTAKNMFGVQDTSKTR